MASNYAADFIIISYVEDHGTWVMRNSSYLFRTLVLGNVFGSNRNNKAAWVKVRLRGAGRYHALRDTLGDGTASDDETGNAEHSPCFPSPKSPNLLANDYNLRISRLVTQAMTNGLIVVHNSAQEYKERED